MSQGDTGKPLWALVPDLFLRVKIESLARAEGSAVRAFASPQALLDQLAAGDQPLPSLVLVDLGAPRDAGFALIEGLSALAGAPPTLAFFSHVDDRARQRAIAAGATRVVPRSALVARFTALVRELGAPLTG